MIEYGFGPLNRFAHVFRPKIASLVFWALNSLRSCNFWAQNRQGLQVNPLQIPQVMDTAALKHFHTGTYKLYPPLVFFGTCVPSFLF